MSGGGNRPEPQSDVAPSGRAGLVRALREDLTIVTARVQLLRRQLKSGTLQATDLDAGLAEIDRAAARLRARVTRLDNDGKSPG